ncbi:LytTR family DNA-binding domain-containing protein [Macrococcus lamae]|uniref:LytTR family transcriptional regulator n=1 Tax=Macrococcus lamae TaxID=198484 RepID=A0A4R6BTM0_9STAP|nr:LytTR family transcriptional regulator DNA-binding domain-containing protein [Macrococcus lamae]TDM07925.1 LytTR family transcriptional regulator [Macrococcus lamae]
MRLELNINPEIKEETITIHTRALTPELSLIIRQLEDMISVKKLYGRDGEDVYPINVSHVTQFIVENKVVYALLTNDRKLRLEQRLYQIEEMMDHRFVRISKSEIINIEFIDYLHVNSNGMIEIFMKQGEHTYSSRHYLKAIKERLEI